MERDELNSLNAKLEAFHEILSLQDIELGNLLADERLETSQLER